MRMILKKVISTVTAAAVILSATFVLEVSSKIAASWENAQEQNVNPVEVVYSNGETMSFDGSDDIYLYLNGRSMDCTVTINSDFVLQTDFSVGPGINAVVEGNGHTITCTKSKASCIYNRGTVTFKNCEILITGEGIDVPFHNENYMTLENCKITGSVATVDGVLIENAYIGTLTINGGEIRTNDNADGSGECCILNLKRLNEQGVLNILDGKIISNGASSSCIENYGLLNVSGGTITGNGTSNPSCCINNCGTFIMTDGEINGEVYYGIKNDKDAELTISGGTVEAGSYVFYNLTGGLASISGGKLTGVNTCIWNNGTLDILNGEITGVNYGVRNYGTLNILNGKITSEGYYPVVNNRTLNISGGSFGAKDPGIKYIPNSGVLNLSGSPEFNNTTLWLKTNDNIGITGEITYSDPCTVYVDSSLPRIITSGWDTHMTGKAPSDYFKSPYPYTKIVNRSDETVITYYTVTYNANGGICSAQSVYVNNYGKITSLAVPTREGYSFLGWFTEETGGEKIDTDTVFNDDTTVYAHWTISGDSWKKDTENSTEPTITEKGEYVYTSEKYGEVTIEVPELSDETVWEKDTENSTDPTLTEKGEYVYISEEYGEVTIEVPELSNENVWEKDTENSTDPTLTEKGEYVYTSEEYGEVTIEVPALSDTDIWTLDESQHVEPTEDQPGKDVYISEYGEVTVIIPPHTHTYSSEWTSDETNHWHAADCGHDVKIDEAAHKWNDGEITKQPTADEAGEKTLTCTVCDKTKTEVIPATGGTDNPDPDNPDPDNPDPDNPDPDNPDPDPDTPDPDNPDPDNPDPDNPDPDNPDPDTPDPDNPDPDNPDPDNPDPDKPDPDNPDPDTPDPDNPDPDNPDPDNPDPDNPDPDNPDPDNPDPDNPDPDDTDNGNISKEVQPGENAPDTELKTPLDELIETVLTPEEQELVDDGVDIKIVLTVEDGTNFVPAEDKEKVETAISGISDCKIGQYLEVNLLKIIGDEQKQITETNAPITLVFVVPEALRGEGRTYSVIRVHNGETDVLSDLDSDMTTVTIETDKFSTYALVYSEKTNVTPPVGGSSGGNFTVPEESGSGSGSGTTAPSESEPADGGDPAPSESGSADGSSGSAPSGNEPADSGNTIPENSGSSDNGTTPPSGEASSTNENGTNPEVGNASADNNISMSGEGADTDNNNTNPATGIAISLIPFMAITVITVVSVKSKKK